MVGMIQRLLHEPGERNGAVLFNLGADQLNELGIAVVQSATTFNSDPTGEQVFRSQHFSGPGFRKG